MQWFLQFDALIIASYSISIMAIASLLQDWEGQEDDTSCDRADWAGDPSCNIIGCSRSPVVIRRRCVVLVGSWCRTVQCAMKLAMKVAIGSGDGDGNGSVDGDGSYDPSATVKDEHRYG